MRPFSIACPDSPARRRRRRIVGMTLVEIMVALAILGVTSVGGISAFTLLNSYASNNRNQTSARQLCQERIEQALSLSFAPPATVPLVTTPMGGNYAILGTSTNWGTGSAALVSGVTTSTETVNIYVQQDGTAAVVPGVRTTSVSCADPSATNVLAKFTVRVDYTYRTRPYSYAMSVLRCSN